VRYEINCIGDSARIDHLEGLIKFENAKCLREVNEANELLKHAKEKLVSSLKKAIEIDWTRGICYIHNKLANITLDLASKNDSSQEKIILIEEAEEYLNYGKNQSIFKNNKRREAGYLLTSARLENMKNSSYNGEEEAISATKIYKEIGDTRKIKEGMEHLETIRSHYASVGNTTKVVIVSHQLALLKTN
jgi:hypothetical protein